MTGCELTDIRPMLVVLVLLVIEGRVSSVGAAIEALGRQVTFEAALRARRPGGILFRTYIPRFHDLLGAFLAALGDHTIVTTLCPGGKERMRRDDCVGASRYTPARDASL
jgi:hypothetical protein